MDYQQILAAIAVSDIDASVSWYTRLFDRPAARRPMSEVAEWQLLPASGVQLVLAKKQAGKSMATIGIKGIEPAYCGSAKVITFKSGSATRTRRNGPPPGAVASASNPRARNSSTSLSRESLSALAARIQ